MSTRPLLAAAVALCVAHLSLATHKHAAAADLLTIGSTAPPLDIEHWVQNGGGKYKPVTKFEDGKVYIVEFWATWCGPCVQSMPHIAQLQKDYAESVQVVSVSDEELETVERFLQRPVRGAKEDADGNVPTYRELTKGYCLTTDPDGSSSADYMEAAAQGGIPTAFIVGKDAKIEWIGHPMSMDAPLKQIVNDTWDREAFAAQLKAEQEAQRLMQAVFAAMDSGDFDKAVKLVDAELEKTDNLQLAMLKLDVLFTAKRLDAAAEHLQSIFKKLADHPSETNAVAWQVYQIAAQGGPSDAKLTSASVAAAKASLTKAKDQEVRASLMDTIAHFMYLAGDAAGALALEKQALPMASDTDRAFMENFVEELQEAVNQKDTVKEDNAK